ncbi:DUF2470 domain-containing protein [Streptomyces sp. ISL-99]|uniref:DUF2470 domain-containing protein n=1 Tax=Streptomyces sp. ISL-99 TaxID=2819193 RepID=UPI001BEA3B2B|nr:DUF2470 domain-containing protein [Streptomyces sp. ISL-99]MBT2526589.1 DUF2470 domain-containing protein [Streptomyces sp. ISL-99]
MGVLDACVARPTSAEQVRTVVAAAGSLMVVTDRHSWEPAGLHTFDDRGRLLLRVPDDCALAAEVTLAPHGIVAAVLRFTDVAPTAVRDRVRARVTLTGWFVPVGGTSQESGLDLRLDFAHAELETMAGTVAVGLDELTLARPDPLAAYEADMLTHLVDDHSDVVALLTRLVDPRLMQGVLRVTPVSMDRYGITLRLEHAGAQHDVRLPFPAPLRDAAEAGGQVQALLAAARACRRRYGAPSRP